jgi:hypothetical protein
VIWPGCWVILLHPYCGILFTCCNQIFLGSFSSFNICLLERCTLVLQSRQNAAVVSCIFLWKHWNPATKVFLDVCIWQHDLLRYPDIIVTDIKSIIKGWMTHSSLYVVLRESFAAWRSSPFEQLLFCRDLLCVWLSAVFISDIEADILDELDGPLELICWSQSCLASVAPSGQARSLCVLHSGQSSRTCSGLWHAHLVDSIWIINCCCCAVIQQVLL